MFCTNCGRILAAPCEICPHCGAYVENPEVVFSARASEPPAEQDGFDLAEEPAVPVPQEASVREEKQPKRRKKTAIALVVTGVLLAGAAAALILTGVPQRVLTQHRYRKGVAMLEAQDYENAYAVFSSLGDYADSEALCDDAARGVAYRSAIALMESGDYRAARNAFLDDPDFEDAPAYIETCDRMLFVEDAKLLYEAGDYAGALDLLESDPEIEEAVTLVESCRRALAVRDAEALYEAGNYAGALDLLESVRGDAEAEDLIVSCRRALAEQTYGALTERGAYAEALDLLRSEDGALFEDRDARVAECENGVAYQAAEEALAAGRKYEAYQAFLALGGFSDAEARAKECLAERPETGELYHSEAYAKSDFVLTVRPPSNGGDTFFRIYAVEQDQTVHVADLFIRSGDVASVELPEGVYLFKAAYGADWFGEPELFGGAGVYQRLRSADDSDLFTLEAGFAYTLALRASEGSGGVDAVDEDPSGF